MTLSLERINKARQSGFDDEQIVDAIAKRDPEFGSRIQRARESGHTGTAILQSIEKKLNAPLNTPVNTPVPEQNPPAENLSLNAPIQSNSPEFPNNSNVKRLDIAEKEANVKPLYMGGVNQDLNVNNQGSAPKQDKGFWDWVMQEPGPDKYEEMIRPREIPREDLKKMSARERYEYAQELNLHREYMQSKGVTKGLISGLTFGLSEKIPALRPQEGEHGALFGEFLGSILPIEGLAKVISWPLLKLAGSSPVYKKGLEAFARITGMGATGATYEGIKEGFKTGELPSAEDLAKHGAAWAALETALQGAGYLARFISKMREAGGSTAEKVNELISKVNLEETNPEYLKAQLDKGIKEVFPERKQLSPEEIAAAKDKVYEEIGQLPEGNKKKLAERAFEKQQVRTPDQLKKFLEEYETIFPGISGKTMKDRNRKFLNKLSESNKEPRKFDIREGGGENVPTLPKGVKLEKPEHISIGAEGGKAHATVPVYKDGAFYHEKLRLTKEEKQLVDGSISWSNAGDNAEAAKLAQEAREMIYKRLTTKKEPATPKPKMSESEKFKRSQLELREAKRGSDKEAIKQAQKKRDIQKEKAEREIVKEEKQAAETQQKVEKEQVKEFEQQVENKELDSIQKKIDVIEDRIKKAETKGKTETVRVLQKNLSIQKKKLQEAKAARKYSVPQNAKEVNTDKPTLVAKNPEKITNVNVVQAISEKPTQTLSKGVYVSTGQQPGFALVTKAIKGAKKGVRSATKWVFKKGGQDILRANPESDLYKKGWRAVEDYMSTRMGLKEKFFTRWQDAIGKNKRISRQDREDMIFYRERTGNPFVKNDTFEALSKRMSPESKEVVDTIVDQHMKESLRLINESSFMSGKGVTPRQAVEDIYIRHFYAGKISPQKVDAIFESMQKRFGTDNPFKNTRTYLTFDQALREAGLVPKYRDIIQNLAAQDGMLVRVLSNNELISNLHDMEEAIGQKLIVRSNDKKAYQKAKEDGWIQFQDPYMRSYVTSKNKAGKKQWAVTEAPALVHPDLAPSLQGVFSKDAYKPDNAVLRLYDRVNSTLNKLHVSASLFHFNALGESFTSGGGFVTSLVMSPKWWKQGSRLLERSPYVEDAVRHGLKLNRPTDLDLEKANTFYQKLMTKMQASNSLPLNLVGKIGESANVLNRTHKFLFGEFQPRMKIITYENYVNRMLRYYEKKGMYPNEELLREIKRQSAKAVNDQFGGQVWELIPFMNDKQKGMHRVFSFPDWGVSAIREVTGAVADNSPIRRKLGQRYLVEYLMGLFFGGQLLSYASTGMTNKPDGSVTWDINKAHSTFENEDPKRRNLFDIEMPDFYITIAGDKINVGRDENGRQYYVHGGKKIREIGRYFTDPIANLFSKSSPLIQDATKFAIDHTPSEGGLFPVRSAYKEGEFQPWDGTKKHTIDRAVSYAKEIATGTLPYSLQTAVSDLFDSKEQFLQAIARTGFKFAFSGGGGLSVSKGMSLRSSEPYWEEAYNIKDPKKREESLKALRVVLKDYGYRDNQIKTIESKIKRRVEGKAEKR